MFLIASNTFWPSARTPKATSSDIAVDFLSRRTRALSEQFVDARVAE